MSSGAEMTPASKHRPSLRSLRPIASVELAAHSLAFDSTSANEQPKRRMGGVLPVWTGIGLAFCFAHHRRDGVAARLAFSGLASVALDVKKLESHVVQHTTGRRQNQGQKTQA